MQQQNQTEIESQTSSLEMRPQSSRKFKIHKGLDNKKYFDIYVDEDCRELLTVRSMPIRYRRLAPTPPSYATDQQQPPAIREGPGRPLPGSTSGESSGTEGPEAQAGELEAEAAGAGEEEATAARGEANE